MPSGRKLYLYGVILLTARGIDPASAGVTSRVSVSTEGEQANHVSRDVDISGDGRFVALTSRATNLIFNDLNGRDDVFVHDRMTGVTERVSVSTGGGEAHGDSLYPSISSDGRFVAFFSVASNLVLGDQNYSDIFVRDRWFGTTELISVSSDGHQANGECDGASISADGRFVAFRSHATNLVENDTNNETDVFVRDRLRGLTFRVSLTNLGGQANGSCFDPVISGNGRLVAFTSFARNLVGNDNNGMPDVYLRDTLGRTTMLVSTNRSGFSGYGHSYTDSISADGRYVSFTSEAGDLVLGDTNDTWDAFVRDVVHRKTIIASIGASGQSGNDSSGDSSISADGRWMAFYSLATNLVEGDENNRYDVFIRDTRTPTTELVSVSSSSEQANDHSFQPEINYAGNLVVFSSYASNLVRGDSNAFEDVFVRERSRPEDTQQRNLVVRDEPPQPASVGAATRCDGEPSNAANPDGVHRSQSQAPRRGNRTAGTGQPARVCRPRP